MFKLFQLGLTKNLKLRCSDFYCRGKKKSIYNFFFLGPSQGVHLNPWVGLGAAPGSNLVQFKSFDYFGG